MTINKTGAPSMEQALSQLLGASVSSVERIYGGQNNRLYRATCSDSERYVAKFYPKVTLGERDRLHGEFSSLDFLWKNGLDSVPKPVAIDTTLGCAIYEHIDGREIPSASIAEPDIDQATRCLVRINGLCCQQGSDMLPIAAEACFSVQDIFNNIDGRLVRLKALTKIGHQYVDLHSFLGQEFTPAFHQIRQWSQSTLEDWKLPADRELAWGERTLSPSDFGFHNAVRRPSGDIVFLDFEYFGWDDPAKMISDFLLHPAMHLTEHLKQRFVDNILRGFSGYEDLARRLAIVYPLFGLKWCLIILNEFLPEKQRRREFAKGAPSDNSEVQSVQLEKAKVLLNRVVVEYSQFPYAG